MMPAMKIGVLRETKIPADTRVPLTPKQCRTIKENFPGTEIVVQPSAFRCFSVAEYKEEHITVNENLEDCDILLGVKEVALDSLIPHKTYFFFSHTIKKQAHNRKLLQSVLNKRITLIDYETLTNKKGIRLIGFGRWAGIIGTYLGIRAYCRKTEETILPSILDFNDLEGLLNKISGTGIPPVRIVLTGDGRVAGGAEEILKAFGVKKVSCEDYIKHDYAREPVYVQLAPDKYNCRKDKKGFDLEHFFSYPGEYESNFMPYLDRTDLLVVAAYWDPAAPVLFTVKQMQESNFAIKVIADISCDLNGPVPSTIRTTSFAEPYYDFSLSKLEEEKPFSNPANLTVMAIDNLPCGLPRESSADFGNHIMKYILPLIQDGDREEVLQRATIARGGSITSRYQYLEDWIKESD